MLFSVYLGSAGVALVALFSSPNAFRNSRTRFPPENFAQPLLAKPGFVTILSRHNSLPG
jgi:hypothetical protein